MTIGTTYRVSTGTLTIKSISKGKDKTFTLWYGAERPEYSCEVQITEESMKRMDNLIRMVK
jgi:hypothetical protein